MSAFLLPLLTGAALGDGGGSTNTATSTSTNTTAVQAGAVVNIDSYSRPTTGGVSADPRQEIISSAQSVPESQGLGLPALGGDAGVTADPGYYEPAPSLFSNPIVWAVGAGVAFYILKGS